METERSSARWAMETTGGRRSKWQMSEGTDSCWSSGFEAEDVEWMIYQASKVWAPMRNLTDGWDLEKFRRKVVFWYAHVCTWICVCVYWRPEENELVWEKVLVVNWACILQITITWSGCMEMLIGNLKCRLNSSDGVLWRPGQGLALSW